jgi:hypothetical protein
MEAKAKLGSRGNEPATAASFRKSRRLVEEMFFSGRRLNRWEADVTGSLTWK